MNERREAKNHEQKIGDLETEALRIEKERDEYYLEWKLAERQLKEIGSSLVFRLTRSSSIFRRLLRLPDIASIPESAVTAIDLVLEKEFQKNASSRSRSAAPVTENVVTRRERVHQRLDRARFERNGYRGEAQHARNQVDAIQSSELWRRWSHLGVEPGRSRQSLLMSTVRSSPSLIRAAARYRPSGAFASAPLQLGDRVLSDIAAFAGSAVTWVWSAGALLATAILPRTHATFKPGIAPDTGTGSSRRPRILIVSPYHIVPPNHGSAVRLFNLVKQLTANFDLTLLLFSSEGEDPSERDVLESMGCRVHFHRWVPRIQADPFRLKPRIAAVFTSDRASAKIRDIVYGEGIDIVQLEHTELGQYVTEVPRGVPVILSEIDVAFRTQYRRRVQRFHDRFDKSSVFVTTRTELLRTFRYELNSCRRADQVQTMSTDDAQLLGKFLHGRSSRIRVIPNAVDTAGFLDDHAGRKRHGVLFVGNFGHLPNIDALEWFLIDVWPLIRVPLPDAKLSVVGANISDHVLRFRDVPGVTIVGEVADTRPYYHRHRVMVAPIRAGSGTRLKILESFAAGLPVVSTTLGAEGIEAEPDTHLLIADSAVDFARATEKLLRDDSTCARVAKEARKLVTDQYDWARVGGQLSECFKELLNENGRGGRRSLAEPTRDHRVQEQGGSSPPPDVSIVIPTLNGGDLLGECLAAIRDQKTDLHYEIICVDSGSSNQDLETMRAAGARLIAIDRADFNHGLTRDIGARAAAAPILIFINQDSVPANPKWLDRLVSPIFHQPSDIAAVQGGIAEWSDRDHTFFWESCGEKFYFTRESKRWLENQGGTGFSTINCSIRKAIWERYPFGWAEIMEDKKWQREVSEAGYEIVSRPAALVHHSHDYSFRQLLRRCYSEGYGWRALGERYRLSDCIKDALKSEMYRRLLTGIRERAVRSSAEVAFPIARPLALWAGNRFGRRVHH